jgi:hypothetical protein
VTRALLRAAALAAALVLLACAPASVATPETKPVAGPKTKPVAGPEAKSFATPEAVVEHFIESVAADDLDATMQAFAIDDEAAHFDFAAQVRRLGSYSPTSIDAPARYKMYVRTNAFAAMDNAAGRVVAFVTAFLIDPAEIARLGKGPRDADAAARVMATLQGMDSNKLRGLKLVRVDLPHKPLMSKAHVLQMLREQGSVWGAETMTERIALLQLADQHYICGFRILKYGSSWRIHDLTSNFASDEAHMLLAPEKITPEEFETRTK